MSSFKKYEGGLLTFAFFFVPLITGMSGNIGLQCSTVLVRSMAVGALSNKMRKEALLRELFIGGLLGAVFGFSLGLIVFLIEWSMGVGGIGSPLAYGAIVGLGLSGACLAGSSLGVFSPLVFSRLGIDPAVSSGPVVTAFNDIISMSIYFLIAWGLGRLFF
jgi:magnesium transporter